MWEGAFMEKEHIQRQRETFHFIFPSASELLVKISLTVFFVYLLLASYALIMSAAPSFATEIHGKWKKRKRVTNFGSNSKKSRPEEDDEEEEDDDEADVDEEEETQTIVAAAAATELISDA